LLADGRSSRLVRELREELRLVHSISSNFSLQRDSSLFTMSACLDPQHLERVEELIGEHLFQLQTTPVSPTELHRCQRLLCNDYTFSTEAASQLAGLYGYYNTIAKAEVAVAYPLQIQSFKPLDLMQLAQQYLSPYHYAVTVLKPLNE
jgi:predicted Zn-dependent peptidase